MENNNNNNNNKKLQCEMINLNYLMDHILYHAFKIILGISSNISKQNRKKNHV